MSCWQTHSVSDSQSRREQAHDRIHWRRCQHNGWRPRFPLRSCGRSLLSILIVELTIRHEHCAANGPWSLDQARGDAERGTLLGLVLSSQCEGCVQTDAAKEEMARTRQTVSTLKAIPTKTHMSIVELVNRGICKVCELVFELSVN